MTYNGKAICTFVILPHKPRFQTNLKRAINGAVGPKRSTNRSLKQIITIECTKTVIFQLLRHLDISKLEKEIAYTMNLYYT